MAFDFNNIDIENNIHDDISNNVNDLTVVKRSVLNVIREKLGISSVYGFKETYNKDLKRYIYNRSSHRRLQNTSTIINLQRKLQASGWATFYHHHFQEIIHEYFPDLIRYVKRIGFERQYYNEAHLLFSYFINNNVGMDLLQRIAAYEKSFIHQNPRWNEIRGYISPDAGIMFLMCYNESEYHYYFILTGIVSYDTAYNTEKISVDKLFKQTEILTRRVCKAYNVNVPASSYKADILDGHVVLHDTGTYDKERVKKFKEFYITNAGYDVLKKINKCWKSKDVKGNPITVPAWYKSKGMVHFVKGYPDNTPKTGIIHWADFNLETNKFDAYIWLTGDITYDYKTGKAVYDKV